MTLSYIWYKLCVKIRGCAVRDCNIEKDAKLQEGTLIVGSDMGKFSYCGYNCFIINSSIGRFCSISDNVSIGGGTHPMTWVSTSPAFYKGKDSIDKRLAQKTFKSDDAHTVIGNDVWIGRGVYIKPGIIVGNGAVIGMGSVVTKNVEPYSVVAGNPAKPIRMRFTEEIAKSLNESEWWLLEEDELQKLADVMDDPIRFLEKINNFRKDGKE